MPSSTVRVAGWSGAVVVAEVDMAAAVAFCRAVRLRDVPISPLLLVIRTEQVGRPHVPRRPLRRLLRAAGPSRGAGDPAATPLLAGRESMRPDIIEYGALVLNLETYQAAIAGRVLDLTYMEYELLRFLAAHPAKVFTRETLLSRVWGYEYYGGARTVDVHVRRLRAKLGEEHAHLIQTVRSVGYRFGQAGWQPGLTRAGRGPAGTGT